MTQFYQLKSKWKWPSRTNTATSRWQCANTSEKAWLSAMKDILSAHNAFTTQLPWIQSFLHKQYWINLLSVQNEYWLGDRLDNPDCWSFKAHQPLNRKHSTKTMDCTTTMPSSMMFTRNNGTITSGNVMMYNSLKQMPRQIPQCHHHCITQRKEFQKWPNIHKPQRQKLSNLRHDQWDLAHEKCSRSFPNMQLDPTGLRASSVLVYWLQRTSKNL